MVDFSRHRQLVRHWNAGVARIPGWPQHELTEPAYANRSAGPIWEEFPQSLRDDIDAYCARIGKRHKTVSGRIFRPCKQSTIDTRRRELIAAVRAAVAAGIWLEELKSLRDLLADRVEILIEHYWEKNGEKPSLYTIDLASKLLALARAEALSEIEIERLDEIRIALEQYRSTGHTEKNRKLIRQIAQSDIWREVIRLPQRLMAEARANRKTKPYRAAVTAQLAVAILLLIRAPVRMQNLASILIGLNLVKPGGPEAPYMLVFPDYDVKNGVPLEFAFDDSTTVIIDEYTHQFRPQLMRGFNHDYLFAGGIRGPKLIKSLSKQISEGLWKELGLEITPHQFRHAAAYIMLKANPGNYELSAAFSATATSPPPGTSTSAWRRLRLRVCSVRWSPTWSAVNRANCLQGERTMPEKVRACPPSDWSTAHREGWKRACIPGQRLKPGGAAARMKPSTRTSLVRADERPVADILTPYIDRWLERWHPLFLEPADAFWPSTKGGPLAYTYVEQIIIETTLRELSVAISPHLFRDCAVYTVAIAAGDRMGIASALLQHIDERTIQKHYNKGALLDAVRQYQQILDQLID
jgi:integrase